MLLMICRFLKNSRADHKKVSIDFFVNYLPLKQSLTIITASKAQKDFLFSFLSRAKS